MLICNAQLTPEQYHDLTQLQQACLQYDKGLPVFYSPLLLQQREIRGNILFYSENKLVGFLSVYFFYHDACEITLLIDPSFRQQGLARQLLHQIRPLILAMKCEFVIFSAPPIKDKWLRNKGFKRTLSEHEMEYHHSFVNYHDENFIKESQGGEQFSCRSATEFDIGALCRVHNACFTEKPHDMTVRFTDLLSDSHYKLFVILVNDTVIGKAHCCVESDCIRISDIAIHPDFQRHGFGRILVAYCLNHGQTIPLLPWHLTVEANNKPAIHLYLSLGFEIKHTFHYWRTTINNFERELS